MKISLKLLLSQITFVLLLFIACGSENGSSSSASVEKNKPKTAKLNPSGGGNELAARKYREPTDSLPARNTDSFNRNDGRGTQQPQTRPQSGNGSTNASNADNDRFTRNEGRNQSQPQGAQNMPGAAKLSSSRAKAIIEQRANEVINLMAKKDFYAMAGYIHPVKGVRFSPYSYVKPDGDRLLKTKEFIDATLENETVLWGHYDGSGEPIKLNFKAYYDKFVYDFDYYRKTQRIGYNEVIGSGNSVINRAQVYPEAICVEYYQANPENEFDWSSLTLVFEKYGSEWYLTGLIHGEWTS